MNRKAIRDLAAKELGLKTARYFYATTYEQLCRAAEGIGFPCIVKPLMSSSGKGQSLVESAADLRGRKPYSVSLRKELYFAVSSCLCRSAPRTGRFDFTEAE